MVLSMVTTWALLGGKVAKVTGLASILAEEHRSLCLQVPDLYPLWTHRQKLKGKCALLAASAQADEQGAKEVDGTPDRPRIVSIEMQAPSGDPPGDTTKDLF